MAEPVIRLDPRKWAKRALLIDIFTLGILMVVGVALIRDAYSLGANLGTDSMAGSINHLLLDVAFGVAALGWLGFRLIRSGVQAMATPS